MRKCEIYASFRAMRHAIPARGLRSCIVVLMGLTDGFLRTGCSSMRLCTVAECFGWSGGGWGRLTSTVGRQG